MLFLDLVIPLSFRGKYNKYGIIKSKIAMLLIFSKWRSVSDFF